MLQHKRLERSSWGMISFNYGCSLYDVCSKQGVIKINSYGARCCGCTKYKYHQIVVPVAASCSLTVRLNIILLTFTEHTRNTARRLDHWMILDVWSPLIHLRRQIFIDNPSKVLYQLLLEPHQRRNPRMLEGPLRNSIRSHWECEAGKQHWLELRNRNFGSFWPRCVENAARNLCVRWIRESLWIGKGKAG